MTSDSSPFAGVPAVIVDLSSNLVDFVERALGLRPDFTPETLSLVDFYAEHARVETRGRTELVDLAAQAIGAYFGEVVRRHEGAFWLIPSPNFHDWTLCGATAFVAINPIGVGYDALLGTTDHGGPSSQFKLAHEDRQAVSDRLAMLPAVREKDYFTLCTRHEVTQIVMDAVRGLAEGRGYSDMEYAAADYGGELRPL